MAKVEAHVAYLTSSVLLFTIAVLLVSFAVPYVKGFVFWDRLLGLGCQFYPPPRRRRREVGATIQAGIASVFALVVTFCRAFYNTFTLTFCITVVCSKGVRRNISNRVSRVDSRHV